MTGDAVNYCGLKHVKYDHYVDIDNIGPGLREIIASRPDLAPYITTGWEECTINKSGSLLTGVSDQPHRLKSGSDVDKVDAKLK
jgi:hypothetical protein